MHDNRVIGAPPVPAAPGPQRKPMWSDLIVNEVNGRREIDVTRVQMLYFTVIAALFVLMRVLTTYVIPEIPQGFQILMGISNAVYFGSKVAQPDANTATANAAAARAPTPAATPTPRSSLRAAPIVRSGYAYFASPSDLRIAPISSSSFLRNAANSVEPIQATSKPRLVMNSWYSLLS